MCLVNHWGRVNPYHRRKTKRLYCLYIYLSERPLTKKEWIDNLALTLYSWGPEGIIVLNISCNRKLLYSMILGGLISDTKVLSKVVYLLNIVKYHVFLFVKLSDLSVWKKTFFFSHQNQHQDSFDIEWATKNRTTDCALLFVAKKI